jgi:hypothetical protein
MQGFYRNHMEEVIKFFETQHKVCRPLYDHSMVTSVNSVVTFAHFSEGQLLSPLDL